MGVNFFGDIAPDDFGSYDLAFVTVFSMTAGNSWVIMCPGALLFYSFNSLICFKTNVVAYYTLLTPVSQ
jgi:hypothetical protein